MERLLSIRTVVVTVCWALGCSAINGAVPTTLQVKSSYGGAWQTKTLHVMEHESGFTPVEHARDAWTEEGSYRRLRSDSTGFYRVEKIGDRWWLIDPNGYATINRAVCCMPTTDIQHNYDMCYAAGFNSSGNFLSSESQTMKVYNAQNLRQWGYTRRVPFYAGYAKVRHKYYPNTPDALKNNDTYIFALDPLFARYCDSIAALRIEPYKDERQMIGWFTDNEIPFQNTQLQLLVRDLPEGDTCRTLAIEWAANHGLSVEDCVNATSALTEDLKNQFVAYVGAAYYRTVYEAIRRYDPNHLIMGSRLHGRPRTNLHLVAASHQYTDVTSVNFYDRYQPIDQITLPQWTQDHPCIVGEFYIKDITRQSKEQSGAGWYVKDQVSRGYWYEHVVLQLIESKCYIGWQYFRYGDDPDGSNKGMTDVNNNEYTALTERMRIVNEQTYALADYYDGVSRGSSMNREYNIPASADTYIEVGTNVNHGSEETMQVRYTRAENTRKEAFIRFEIPRAIVGDTLEHAELRLTVTAGSGKPLLMVSLQDDGSWQENSLTGTLRTGNEVWKSVYERVASVYDSIKAQTYVFDLTPVVKSMAGVDTLAVKVHALSVTNDAVVIATRENSDATVCPQLIIRVKDNEGTGIDPVSEESNEAWYTVTGQKIDGEQNTLPSGVYVSKKQKIFVP